MAEHVVHLPGDAGPLGGTSLLGAQLLLRLGALSALSQ